MPTNLYVIVLVHNQAQNLQRILDACAAQTLQPIQYIFVLDRCTDASADTINKSHIIGKVTILEVATPTEQGFYAGYCRDIGIAYAHSHAGTDANILFLDGDCIPSVGLVESSSTTLDTCDIVTGCRNSQQEDGTTVQDPRYSTPWLNGEIFTHGQACRVKHLELARARMLTWSCCLGISGKAQIQLSDINKALTGNARVFSSAFDGTWGGEDDFVGLTAMLLDMRIVGLASEHHVQHLYHPSRASDMFMEHARVVYASLVGLCTDMCAPGLEYLNADPNRFASQYFSINR